MEKGMPKTYNEQMQHIVEAYRKAGEPWPATSRAIASWAISNGLWQPQQSTVISQCAEHIARAMREEYITDPQGRSVRTKHAAKISKEGCQMVLWADIRSATPDHMQVALQQRRHQIVGDCRQLKYDADSFNDNYNTSQPIQISFDFTRDLQEIEAGLAAD